VVRNLLTGRGRESSPGPFISSSGTLTAPKPGAVQRLRVRPRDPTLLRRTIVGYLFISPVVLGLLIWTFGPMIASAYFSLTDYKVLKPPTFIGIDNYVELLTRDRQFLNSMFVTLKYAVLFVILGQVFSLSLAVLLTQKVRGIAIFRTLFYLPVVVPFVASALLWRYLFNKDFGPINGFLEWIGLDGINWLGSTDWALPSLVIISVWGGAISTIIYVAGLQHIPDHLHEAARIDGANGRQQFRYVTLPLLTPTIFFSVVTTVIASFQFFVPAYVMTQGNPAKSTYVYNLNLYDKAFKWLEMGYASAMAWVMFAIIIVLTLILFRTSNRWVHYEGEARS
jgi:multiple sugar transport system permease protein